MEFDIRYKISELEEEIYSFEVCNNFIKYKGFWLSKRKNLNEPFGYDWSEHYEAIEEQELNALEKEFGEDVFEYYHPEHDRIEEIRDRYNPIMHGLLSGVFSNSVAKEHPLKISEEFIKTTLIEKIKDMKVK